MKVTALGVHSAFAAGNVVEGAEIYSAKQTDNLECLNGFKEGEILGHSTNVRPLYDPKFQSNFLIEFDKEADKTFNFVLDFGQDIRHSLVMVNLSVNDIDAWYCSHPHADHIGGIEGIALSTFFNPYWSEAKHHFLDGKSVLEYSMDGSKLPDFAKPEMWGHREVLKSTWKTAYQGLNTLQGVDNTSMDTFFNVRPMTSGNKYQIVEMDRFWKFYTIESTHVVAGMEHMPSFGLIFESSDGKKIYFPTDTLLMMPPTMEAFYRSADYIYQDCETGFRSGVHSHIDDIRKTDPDIKKKCYLYHYADKPEVEEGEFAGVLERGDVQEY